MCADRGQGITRFLAALCMTLVLAACGGGYGDRRSSESERLLISDQFNNRVIEIDTAGNILWHFGNGPADLVKIHALVSDGLDSNRGKTVDFDIGTLAAGESRRDGTSLRRSFAHVAS